MSLLQATEVAKRYGGLAALSDVDLSVGEGEFVAVIGPNGAGKSTLLNVLTGLVLPDGGRVLLDGWDMTRAATHKRVRGGLGRTFQHGRPFARLSVLENVMTGAAIQSGRSELDLRERAMAVLDQMGLAADAQAPIESLSYGHRRMVEMCRALACEPRVLLLDEPAAGLNSAEVDQLVDRLTELRGKHRIAIVLIEHNMGMVMRLAERIMVLNFGCKIAEGTPSEIQSDPAVLSAYLGEGYRHAGV
ncbi:ABC transporter ATP-binding protein [Bradyrhizobium centrolobii]|uniref:High-affinity branched-chain amino acid ABC transporter ATP-binding protein LivG n=2 Tax=Bradyrhizobium TaxID=374 RepID=A0A176Z863_9BRAD|nr:MULTISPECIES: ABC transporter ATP-binding protein [Bradyrhizobium]OAF16438.1 ABC transporter ATP-binding protein [Bradyrhizobium centrolobii]OAF16901.1 high-affinity branched-chain amino acid ABC transporter ATP-binding protein LivG [Bradyrhizobium neotropicale]